MLTFNATGKCGCSRPKKTTQNFCRECWGMVPERLQNRYTDCCEDLHRLTLDCRKHTMVARRK